MRTMILVIVAALAAVCGADKLDQTYLPPVSAKTAGGSPGFLQAPLFRTFEQGPQGVPSGGYTNEFQGVIVDAVNPATRTSGVEETGLGGPRSSYGSIDSKVGDAAFKAPSVGSSINEIASSRIAPGFESFVTSDNENGNSFRTVPGFHGVKPAAKGYFGNKGSEFNTVKYSNDKYVDKYDFGYKSDNGIALGVDGSAEGGAQGGYVFKTGDYKEATGVVNDGSYDAQKYNAGGDYSDSNNGNKYNDRQPSNEDKDATSGSFVIQSDQPNSSPVSSLSQGSIKYSTQGTKPGSLFGNSPGSRSGQFGVVGQSFTTQAGYKPQFGSSTGTQFGQVFPSGSPVKSENRFGVQSTSPSFGSQFSYNKDSKIVGVAGTPSRINSAYSSAVSTGSGSATAFAQTGSESETQYPSQQTFGSKFQGSNSAANPATPSVATAFASESDSLHGAQFQLSGVPQSQASATVEPGQTSSFASAQNLPQNLAGSTFGQSSTGFGIEGQYTSQSNKGPVSGKPQSGFPSSATASASVTPKPQAVNFGSQTPQQLGTIQTQSSLPGQFSSGFGSGYNSFQSQTPKVQPGQVTQNSGSFSSVSSSPIASLTVKPVQSNSGFSSFGPKHVPATDLSTPFQPNEKPSFASTPRPQTSQFGSSSFQSTFSQGSSGLYNKFGASQTTPTPIPSSTQKQGKDSSYYYNQPNKAFVTPTRPTSTGFSNFPVSSVSQGSQYPNTSPTSAAQTGQYQINGVTQATASAFPSDSGTSFTQLTSLSGSNPGVVSQSSTQTGTQESILNRRPFVQSQTTPSSTFSQSAVDSTVSPLQGYGGTIYEYNKPAEVLPTPKPDQEKPTQVSTGTTFGSQFSQGSSQFGSQSSKPISSFQQTQSSQTTFGSQSSATQFGQKPSITTTQFGVKPFGSSQFGNSFQQGQFGSSTGSQFGQKPQTTLGSSFTSNKYNQAIQTTQFGVKPFGNSQTSAQGSQTTQKPFGSSLPSSSQQTGFSSSQAGRKPTSTVPGFGSVTSSQGQAVQTTQFGLSSQTTGSSVDKTQSGGSSSGQFGQQPQTTLGSSFTSNKYNQAIQTTQFGVKPFGSSQTSAQVSQTTQKPFGSSLPSSSQQSVFSSSQAGLKPTSTVPEFGSVTSSEGQAVQTTQYGLSSQTTGSSFDKTQSGGSSGGQFGQPPQTTLGSSFTSNKYNQAIQTTQFGVKPFGSSQTSAQVSQTAQKPFGSTLPSSFQQTGFGSPQTDRKPTYTAPGLGSVTSSQGQAVQTTQFGSKHFGSSQTAGLQFGQQPQTTVGASTTLDKYNQAVQTTQFGLSSQTTGTNTQQFQLGTSGTQFGVKPQTTGSSFTVNAVSQSQSPQSQQESSDGPEYVVSTFQQGETGSLTDTEAKKPSGVSQTISEQSQFGSITNTKPSGSSQPTSFSFQQTQFSSSTGSQYGQKPQINQESTFSSLPLKGQTQFGQKPFSISQASVTSQQSQVGTSSGSAFGQKPSTPGSSFSISTVSPLSVQKPLGSTQNGGSSSQQTQLGTTSSQYGKKPFEGSQTTVSTFPQNRPAAGSLSVQKPQSTLGSSFGSTTFGQKPFGSSQSVSSFQQNQFSQKPSNSAFQQNKYGSSLEQSQNPFGQKPQSGSSFSISTVPKGPKDKPFGGSQPGSSSYQSTQFGSTASSYGQKPFGSFQQTQFGSSTGSQFGQKPQSIFNQQNKFGSTTQQTQFGSTFDQKPQTNAGSSFSLSTVSQGQPTETTQKPFGSSQIGTGYQQSQFGSSTVSKGQIGQYGQKPFGSLTTGSTFQQNQEGTTLFGQKPQSTGSSFSTSTVSSQNDKKPFGSQTGLIFQQNQFGSTTGSQFGKKPLGTSQVTGTKFQSQFSSSTGSTFGQKPQVNEGTSSTSGSKVVQTTQFGVSQTGSSFPQSQFGSSTGSQFGQKPQTTFGTGFASTSPYDQKLTYGTYVQQNQLGSSTGSQFSQKPSQGAVQSTGTVFTTQYPVSPKQEFGSDAQKPFGSLQPTQTGFQQTQIDSSGSYFGKKPLSNVQTGSVFGTQSQFGSQTQKPFGSTYQQNQFGSVTGQYAQKPQSSSASAFASTTGTGSQFGTQPFGSSQGSKFSISTLGQKPYGSSQTIQQSQFTQGSTSSQGTQTSLSGVNQPSKPVDTGSAFQTQFSQSLDQKTQPTKSSVQSTVSTIQSTPSSLEINGQPGNSLNGQIGAQTSKPQLNFEPTQASAFASTSQPDFGSQTFKPFGVVSTQSPSVSGTFGSTQFGAQSTEGSGFSTTIRVPGQPVGNALQVPTTLPTILFGKGSGKPYRTSDQGSLGQTQATASATSGFGGQTAQSTAQTSRDSQFFDTNTALQSVFGAKPIATASAQSSVSGSQFGVGERFGGARDAPRFDEKTGYHY